MPLLKETVEGGGPVRPGAVVLQGGRAVHCVENHDEAYHVWKRAAVRGRVLVHIDAHIDFLWIAEDDPAGLLAASSKKEFEERLKSRSFWNLSRRDSTQLVHVGNYIYPAIKEGLVREFYWVVPDPCWDRAGQRDLLLRIVENLKRLNPGETLDVRVSSESIELSLAGARTVFLKLSALPKFDEDVLLDIDTDYFLARSLDDPPLYLKEEFCFPWMWPEGLVAGLRGRGIRWDVATVAYSVEGGFVPLSYKFLGDDIAALLRHGRSTTSGSFLREAAQERRAGRPERALERLRKGLSVTDPESRAALSYAVAELMRERGEAAEAGFYLKQAVEDDPSYATLYNSPALRAKGRGDLRRAVTASRAVLEVLPDETRHRLVLAESLLDSGLTKDALVEYEKVLRKDPLNAAAFFGSGRVRYRRNEFVLARDLFLRGLALNDLDAQAHLGMGRTCARLGEVVSAVRHLQKSVLLGLRAPSIYFEMAWLFALQGNLFKAREKFWAGGQALRLCQDV